MNTEAVSGADLHLLVCPACFSADTFSAAASTTAPAATVTSPLPCCHADCAGCGHVCAAGVQHVGHVGDRPLGCSVQDGAGDDEDAVCVAAGPAAVLHATGHGHPGGELDVVELPAGSRVRGGCSVGECACVCVCGQREEGLDENAYDHETQKAYIIRSHCSADSLCPSPFVPWRVCVCAGLSCW